MFRRVWGLKPGCWVDVPCTVGVDVPCRPRRSGSAPGAARSPSVFASRRRFSSAGRPENALRSLEPLHFGAEQGRGEVPRAPKLHVSALEIAGLPELRFQGRIVVIGSAEEEERLERLFDGEELLGFDSESRPSSALRPQNR